MVNLLHQVGHHLVVLVIVDVQVHLRVVKIVNDSPIPMEKNISLGSRSRSLSVPEAKLWSIYSTKLVMTLSNLYLSQN